MVTIAQEAAQAKGKNQPIILTEWERSELLELTKADIGYIQETINEGQSNKNIEVIPERKGQRLKSKNQVGVLSLPDGRTIYIQPKITIDNFLRILSYVWEIREWESYEKEVTVQAGDLLIELVAKMFIAKAREVMTRGLFKSYTSAEENSALIRGRILFETQLRKSPFLDHMIYCRYNNHTVNIIENRAMLFVAYLLGNLVRDYSLRSDLREIILGLRSVEVELARVRPMDIEKVTITRLNEHYAQVLKLCKLVLKYIKIEKIWEKGEIPIFSLLIDMPVVFQDFIYKLLCESFMDYEVRPQKKIPSLVEPVSKPGWSILRTINLKPDNILLQENDPRLIVDAKYKKDYDTADVYQATAYSLAKKVPAVLILPIFEKSVRGFYRVMAIPDRKIYVITLNLNPKGESLDEYIGAIKEDIQNKIAEIFKTA